jgi:MprA protease rhombosortase-interaction domain-containing protein
VNRTGTFRGLDPFAILSFIIPLFIYLLTLAPSVTFFDSGEFLTAVSSLGTAHSPGYPLFINYAKPFTFLPFGSIAFRINIATAVSAGLACYGVYLLSSHLLKDEAFPGEERTAALARRLVPLCAALTFACTARLWLQSNHDKPYPLLAFICAIVLYLMLLWRESYLAGAERPSYVYLGAFLCGLGTGAHQIMVLMIPVYALLLISADRRVFLRVKEFLIALAFGILGFGIHLHLIVRALQKPLLNWGDSKNLTQFLWNLLRKGYPVEKPVRDLKLLWAQMNAFNVPYEFSILGLLLLVIGLAAFARRKGYLTLSYMIGVFSFLAVIAGYFNTPFEVIFLTEEFFTPLYLFSAVIIGLGMFVAAREVAARLPAGRSLRVGLLALLFTFPLAICLHNFRENDQHENYIAFDYASNTLRSLPENAVMFTWGDSGAFPLWYLQGVERMREDLILPHTPHLVFDWYLDGFAEFQHSQLKKMMLEQLGPENALAIAILEQYARRPVYIDFSTRYSVPFSDFVLHQRGICYRLDRAGTPIAPPDPDVWPLYSLRNISEDGGMFFRDLDTGKAIQIYAASRLEAGESLLKLGYINPGVSELDQARRISPELGPQVSQTLNSYGVR